MNENIQHAMEQLLAVGGIQPHLLHDDTIEIHPAGEALSLIAAGILEEAELHEIRSGVWGVAVTGE